MKRNDTFFLFIGGGIVLILALVLTGCGKKQEQAARPSPPTSPPGESSATESPLSVSGAPPGRPGPATMPTGPIEPPRPTTVAPATMPATRPALGATPPSTAPLRPDLAAPATSKVASFLGLEGPKPATWVWNPPKSSLNVAEYTIPGVEGADMAKLTVTPAGGSLESNIARWKTQFRDAAGNIGTVEPTIERLEVAGMPVTFLEMAGDYKGAGATNFGPDHLMLMAIVEASPGQIFVKLVGPRKTVQANREAFMTLIKGLHPVEPQK